jgi:hypothetical protein
MNYRILINLSILIFVILTLRCNNTTSPNNHLTSKKDIIGTWVDTHTTVDTNYVIYRAIQDSISYDSLYHPHPHYHIDTVDTIYYNTHYTHKTYSIAYDTIKISKSNSLQLPCPFPGCVTPTLTGRWSLINDSLLNIYPIQNIPAFSTHYLVTKHLPDSLIFSSSDGIDTCVKQSTW